MTDDVCASIHNPGMWPYTARCVAPDRHTDEHVDRHGGRWANTGRRVISLSGGALLLRVMVVAVDDRIEARCNYTKPDGMGCGEVWILNHGTLPRIIRHLMEHETEGS